MITGVVQSDEAVVPLRIRGRRGRETEIQGVIDTGFTAWLTLPPAVVTQLGLRWHSFGRGILADGSESVFDVYEAKVVWDNRVRRIRVYEFDATPLVGMALMRGSELKIQVRSRGKVTIHRLPRRRRNEQ